MQDRVCPWCTLTWQTSLSPTNANFQARLVFGWLFFRHWGQTGCKKQKNKKNASKWNGCILQLRYLTKRIVSKEFKRLDYKKFVSQTKYLMHTYIMKRIHNLPLLLLRQQNVDMLNANTEGNLCENENLKQIWERRETLLQTSWSVQSEGKMLF